MKICLSGYWSIKHNCLIYFNACVQSLEGRTQVIICIWWGIVVVKYVLCIVTILLLVVDAFIYFDLKKYIKVHENELVENHIKGLLGRAIAMTVISVCVGVIAIILQIM